MSSIPTTPPAQKIAALFGRRLTTPWSEKEIKAYKQLVKDGLFMSLTDLNMVERYHLSEKRKGDKGFHRRELQTFLNNFRGEIDKARDWNERKIRFSGFKKSQEQNGEKPLNETEFIEAGKVGLKILAQCKEKLKRNSGSGMKTVIIALCCLYSLTLYSCQMWREAGEASGLGGRKIRKGEIANEHGCVTCVQP